MLDKLKQLNELRKLQSAIKQMRIEGEKEGLRVVMRGDFEIEELVLNPTLDLKAQERALRDLLNETRMKMQKELAKNLGGSLGM